MKRTSQCFLPSSPPSPQAGHALTVQPDNYENNSTWQWLFDNYENNHNIGDYWSCICCMWTRSHMTKTLMTMAIMTIKGMMITLAVYSLMQSFSNMTRVSKVPPMRASKSSLCLLMMMGMRLMVIEIDWWWWWGFLSYRQKGSYTYLKMDDPHNMPESCIHTHK